MYEAGRCRFHTTEYISFLKSVCLQAAPFDVFMFISLIPTGARKVKRVRGWWEGMGGGGIYATGWVYMIFSVQACWALVARRVTQIHTCVLHVWSDTNFVSPSTEGEGEQSKPTALWEAHSQITGEHERKRLRKEKQTRKNCEVGRHFCHSKRKRERGGGREWEKQIERHGNNNDNYLRGRV